VKKTITDRTKAIIGVEVFGNPTGIEDIALLAGKHEIAFIEDACEGIGGAVRGTPIGKFGRAAVFGFYPNKQITTGEGGMIVTDDDRLADMCRSTRNQGRPCARIDDDLTDEVLASWLMHVRLGYNFRLNEISAALGVEQMKRLDEMLDARQRVAEMYMRRLGGNPHLILPTIEPDVFMSWFVYVVRLNDQFTRDDRDEILRGLRRHDVGAGDYFPPIPLLPFYREKYGYQPGDFPCAESVSHRTIALPFYTKLRERDVDLICQTLELMISRITFARD
jgi:perosamine synthetase